MEKILSPMEKIRFPESEELPEGAKEIDVSTETRQFKRNVIRRKVDGFIR